MIRFFARHRRVITILFAALIIGGIAYLAVKTKNLRTSTYDDETFAGTAFGTAVKKTIYSDDEALRESVSALLDDEFKNLEQRISYRNVNSEVAINNRSYVVDGVTAFSPDLLMYIKRELEISKETEGAFSPCILPITQLWGIEDGKNEVPSQEAIDESLTRTNADDMEIADGGVIFHTANMATDFGAVGKGIAADTAIDVMSKSGINGGVVSIGGTIAVYGDKGNGKSWHIGIQDPRDEDGKVLGVVDVTGNTVISTSGDYEKYFELDGKRYHHIFDPATGYPADNGLISVTIITPDGFLSDALSTACFVMGLENGLSYAEEKGVSAIFVTSDKKVYLSMDLKKKFNIKADGYEVVKK